MAFEQYFSQEWRSTPATQVEPENCKGCFDCNICLEFAQEPVVTLCGHLYCWPCIYKWLHVQSLSLAMDEPPQCPVCKAGISHTAMVPLYGRGRPELEGKGLTQLGTAIPPRPAASNTYCLTSPPTRSAAQQLPYRNPYQDHANSFDDSSGAQSELFSLGGAGFQSPMVGMFGEMVYARVFRNSDSLFGYINPYNLRGSSSSPRLRRQEIQADKSLNRISIFLFCCFLLCLIVF
ncbi:E3 ubiquitin-protein ligase RMA1H1-like isoform X2 [Punica granatum]|nr:E3 ubiquitin-protein ligase RMA1H1-like isoform X2 [Punica granatum]OWM91239.1 hypothetical protein CDL15_Pgr000183 [Punica granatum]PKI79512.1 hypothetical protein CRG98_000143 [Punica granatum]